jgi:membrane protease YdiL (CAAX protease family)
MSPFLYFLAACILGTFAAWFALMGRRDRFPNVAQAVALLLAGLSFQMAFLEAGNLFVPTYIDPHSALAQLSALVLYGVPVVLGFWHTGLSRKDLVGWFPSINLPTAGCAILIGLGLLGFSALLTQVLRNAGIPTFHDHPELGFSGLLIAPILEEVFFRGLILRGLLSSRSKAQAIAISSVLFAVAHGDIARIPALTVSGVAYAFVATESGTLLYPILAHTARNGLTPLFRMLGTSMSKMDHADGIALIVMGSLVALGGFALFRLREHFLDKRAFNGQRDFLL